ncbi:MAG: hypothetical protein H6735_11630 [Alphaproteobacteria bacterium]|nr:hypothetical protein [Alphaproteobacteria bacterium]
MLLPLLCASAFAAEPSTAVVWTGGAVATAGLLTVGTGVLVLYSPGDPILSLDPVETTTSLRTGTALFDVGTVALGAGVATLDVGALVGAYAARAHGHRVSTGLGWASVAMLGAGAVVATRSPVLGDGLFVGSGVLGLAQHGKALHVSSNGRSVTLSGTF